MEDRDMQRDERTQYGRYMISWQFGGVTLNSSEYNYISVSTLDVKPNVDQHAVLISFRDDVMKNTTIEGSHNYIYSIILYASITE